MSTKTNTGGPAFPQAHEHNGTGMTLRDWFAGQIMNGMVSSPDFKVDIDGEFIGIKRAGVAYAIADAMLAEREK